MICWHFVCLSRFFDSAKFVVQYIPIVLSPFHTSFIILSLYYSVHLFEYNQVNPMAECYGHNEKERNKERERAREIEREREEKRE